MQRAVAPPITDAAAAAANAQQLTAWQRMHDNIKLRINRYGEEINLEESRLAALGNADQYEANEVAARRAFEQAEELLASAKQQVMTAEQRLTTAQQRLANAQQAHLQHARENSRLASSIQKKESARVGLQQQLQDHKEKQPRVASELAAAQHVTADLGTAHQAQQPAAAPQQFNRGEATVSRQPVPERASAAHPPTAGGAKRVHLSQHRIEIMDGDRRDSMAEGVLVPDGAAACSNVAAPEPTASSRKRSRDDRDRAPAAAASTSHAQTSSEAAADAAPPPRHVFTMEEIGMTSRLMPVGFASVPVRANVHLNDPLGPPVPGDGSWAMRDAGLKFGTVPKNAFALQKVVQNYERYTQEAGVPARRRRVPSRMAISSSSAGGAGRSSGNVSPGPGQEYSPVVTQPQPQPLLPPRQPALSRSLLKPPLELLPMRQPQHQTVHPTLGGDPRPSSLPLSLRVFSLPPPGPSLPPPGPSLPPPGPSLPPPGPSLPCPIFSPAPTDGSRPSGGSK
jgi:hypothetical protein